MNQATYDFNGIFVEAVSPLITGVNQATYDYNLGFNPLSGMNHQVHNELINELINEFSWESHQ